MSTFAVTLESIGSLKPIKGADRIEIATLAGMDFQFVVGKGQYQVGEKVLYIPVDSILPPKLIEDLGLVGKLAGADHNRVKTVVLRGAYSQGLVISPTYAPSTTENIAEYLGITKWDPPPNEVKDGILMPLMDGQSMYDLESADRYVDLAELLMDQPVFITEKLEGENGWVRALPDGTYTVGMRSNTIHLKEGVPNRFHEAFKVNRMVELALKLAKKYNDRVITYGEFIGPGCGVGNYYDLDRVRTPIFCIKVGMRWLTPEEFLQAQLNFVEPAPILQMPDGTTLREWLNGKTVKEASNGMSLINPSKRREGIVIKPLVELRDDRIGRLVLKQRSPAYLANTDL